MHILVVDNHELTQKICTLVLEKQGHTVEHAPTGFSALKMLSEKQYDLVFLELFLRDMSALNILEKIKEQPIIPIILTSYHSVDLIRRAVELGAASYIFKPVDPDNLEATIAMCRQRFEMEKEQRDAKRKLLESQQKYKTLVDGIHEGIVIVQDGLVRFMNRGMANLLGIKITKAVHKPFHDVFAARDADRVYQKMLSFVEQGVPMDSSFGMRNFADKKLTVHITASKIQFENRTADMFVFDDVTEATTIQKKMERVEEKYKIIHENSSDAFLMIDQDGQLQDVNRAAENILGYERNDLLKMRLDHLVPQQESMRAKALLEEMKNIGGLPPTEMMFMRKDSRECRGLLSAVFINYNSYLLVFCDLNQKTCPCPNGQTFLHGELFARILPGAVYSAESSGKIEFFSSGQGAFGNFMLEGALKVGSNWFDAIHPSDRDRVVAEWSRDASSGQRQIQEYRLCDPNGQVRWVRDYRMVARTPDNTRIFEGFLMDISQVHHLEIMLTESERRFRNFVGGIPAVVYSLRLGAGDKMILDSVSPYLNRLLGYNEDEAYELGNESLLIHLVVEEDRPTVRELFFNSLHTKKGNFRVHYRMRHKDGSIKNIVNRGRVGVNSMAQPVIEGTLVEA